jgi:ATP-dependent RNA helicase SUPV3L1/SUV3
MALARRAMARAMARARDGVAATMARGGATATTTATTRSDDATRARDARTMASAACSTSSAASAGRARAAAAGRWNAARGDGANARGATFATSSAAARARSAGDAGAKDARGGARRARASMTPEIQRLLDMRDPAAAYPLARSMRREITLHVGPTNSGKTYAAMQRLKRAGSGVYCAPLRLLAWEISENMNREGVPCTLVTGQERRVAPNASHDSCTVEMSDLSKVMDCAVIDEIQLLSDPLRGYAYTRALLGLPALELHLCGDPRVVPLVRRIVKSTGDLLVVKEYDRLSPLEVSRDIVKSVKDVRKGDAFVAFSRSAVYDLKRELEQKSPHRACVIYGGLPPETRSRQAELFNKPDSGYDVLIASDAIGMGLNLNIKRVIFTTMSKFDGSEMRKLAGPETRQIAGRAGRYGLNYADMGIVTTTKKADYDLLAAALEGELEPLTQAGLAPSLEQVEEYCELRPEAGLVGALQALSDSAKLAPHFRMRDMEESIAVAKLLEKLPLTLADHFLFSIAPVDIRDSMVVNAMMKFARVFCTHGRAGVRLISLPPARTPTAPHELQKLESAHKCLDLYLWLARRLPNAFPEENLADAYRTATATAISAGLQYLSLLSQKRLARAKQRRRGFSATTETADSLATPVVDALHPSAVHDAFTAVLRATKDVEDERERAGLARIDAAERKAASSAESAWTRNAQRKPAQRKPGKVHILRDIKPSPKKTTKLSTTKSIARDASSAERAESPPPSPSPRRAAASHLKPSWL